MSSGVEVFLTNCFQPESFTCSVYSRFRLYSWYFQHGLGDLEMWKLFPLPFTQISAATGVTLVHLSVGFP